MASAAVENQDRKDQDYEDQDHKNCDHKSKDKRPVKGFGNFLASSNLDFRCVLKPPVYTGSYGNQL